MSNMAVTNNSPSLASPIHLSAMPWSSMRRVRAAARTAATRTVSLSALQPSLAAAWRWSSRGHCVSADPHAHNEVLDNLSNHEIIERLTSRDKELKLIPSVATSWEPRSPTVWRFALRRGVVFHDGSPFTADDVVSSFE